MKNENTQHTPGPWIIGEQIINEYGVVVTSIDAPNAEPNEVTNLANVFGDDPEDQANAQLIARAPELLKENQELKGAIMRAKSVSTKRAGMSDLWNEAYNEGVCAVLRELYNGPHGKIESLNAELLECLKGMTEEFSNLLDVPHNYKELEGWPGDENPKLVIWNRAVQAIAKAEGKTLAGS